MTPNETQGAKGFYKLSWLQRIGFGSGDLAQNLIYQTISMYLLFFYTNSTTQRWVNIVLTSFLAVFL